MIEQAVTITDSEIVVLSQFFVHKDFSITHKELLLDIFAKNYKDQLVRIKTLDGENIQFSGFVDFIEYVTQVFNIPYNKIILETHNGEYSGNFQHRKLVLGIFVSIRNYIPAGFQSVPQGKKFAGAMLGRFNPTRLRLAYEIDQAFANDNYTVFQPTKETVANYYRNFNSLYTNELDWLSKKTFDVDMLSTHPSGMIDWQNSCQNYLEVQNNYDIEIISETDCFSDFWFTEKTARCLAIGKPFVLLSGQYSLKRLKDLGFYTFDSIINESYDESKSPTDRIQKIVNSLVELKNTNRIADMYEQAKKNIEIYQEFAKNQREQ
jgi:hypothetical protein